MQNPKFAFKANFGFLCLMRMRTKIRQRYNVPLSRINQCNAEPFVSENGVFGGKRRQLRFFAECGRNSAENARKGQCAENGTFKGWDCAEFWNFCRVKFRENVRKFTAFGAFYAPVA